MRRAGLLGSIAGVAAASAAAGLAVERYAVGRTRLRQDPAAGEPFGELAGDDARTVYAEDGVPLHVETAGQGTAALVFVHGYVLDRRCWHYQWRDLRDVGRLVVFDQRSHGRSGRGRRESASIDQLGRDLLAVLDEVVPAGPVVLVGHSMGGMAIMALADQRPELFGRRVAGVALVSTSTGRLAEVTLGLPTVVRRLLRSVTPVVVKVVERRADLVERGRRMGSDVAFLLTRWYSFGSGVSPSLVAFVERMIASTPVDVMAEFLPALLEHDKATALAPLRGVPTLVLTGSRDKQTPVDHSGDIAAAVPGAELVVVPGAGHLVMLERPDEVNARLLALVRRATSASDPGRRTVSRAPGAGEVVGDAS